MTERSEGKTKVIGQQSLPFTVLKPNNIARLVEHDCSSLQQHLPSSVCAEGCETVEEQSDDEVRTSQVPERREGKTKMMRK